jgi:proteic killer suppression protein
MIASFRSKALERFWWKGEVKRVDPRHVKRLLVLLDALEDAKVPDDMDQQGFGFHQLSGGFAGRFSMKVDKNWRVTFGWMDGGVDAVAVDYEDYH